MSDVFQMVPVRPELAKIRHFGQILKVVDNLRALFSACQYIAPTLAKVFAIGQISKVSIDQISKYHLTIWSHWSLGGQFFQEVGSR